jgi:hypothetical protein
MQNYKKNTDGQKVRLIFLHMLRVFVIKRLR